MAKAKTIAVALEIDLPYPHHQQVYLGIRRFVREHGHWDCVLDEHPGYAMKERGNMTRYDGVIARASRPLQNRLKRMGVPLVNVKYPNRRPGLATVGADPRILGRLAAEHLLDRGFTRMIAAFKDEVRLSWEMAQAFKERVVEAEAACRVMDLTLGEYENARDWVQIEKDIYAILDALQPPTAVFVEQAEDARLIVQYAKAYGFHIPQDIAIICQQNIELIVTLPPQITSLDPNYQRVGYEAAALLDRMMDGEPAPAKPILVPPIGVIGRETTDYFAVEDELVSDALRYVSSRLHQKLRVEDIAYELNVSTRLLQIRFSEALGVAVSDEIRRLRLEKAKRLLAEPDRLIGSIPSEVGFATLYVMNQVFHRALGMSPRAYRKQVMGKN